MNSKSRTKQLYIKCAARNCYNTSFNHPSLKFFPFPKDYTYARVWAKNCKRDDIASKSISVMMRYSLCAEHFQDKYFNIYYEPKTIFRKDLQPIPMIFDTQGEHNAVDPLEVKSWEDSKEDILLDTYTNTYMNVPLELPEDIGPNSEFGKLNYTEDLYEDFVSNPNVLNVQTNVADRLILRDYCRLCAKQLPIASLIPIFDNKFLNYGDMLEYVLPGLCKEGDIYPHQICSSCIGKLESSYNALKSFKESDRILKNIFDKKTDNFTEEIIKSVSGVSNLLNTLERKSLITVSADSKTEQCTKEEVKQTLTTHVENIENNTNNKIEEEVQIKYQCSLCSKLFNNEREIRDHSKFRHCDITSKNYRIVKVKLCRKKDKPKTNISNTEIQKSPNTNDTNEPQSKENAITTAEKFYYIYKHQCSICYKVYRKQQQLIYHTKDQHPELEKPESKLIKVKKKCVIRITPKLHSTTRFECLHCHTQHRTKETLLKHTRLHHPAVKDEKVLCRILKSKKYRNHSITCLRCSETFESIKKYRLHMVKHAIYKCEHCGIIFDKFYKLQSHKKIHNAILHSCIECNKEFPNKKELTKHEETHIENENVECDICKKICSSKFELRKHKRNHEASLCNICGKLFSSETKLKYHIQTHSDTRPYQCSDCKKSFKTAPNLAKHKECHALDKKYVCQFCGKQFRTRGTIKQHMQLHKGFKKHSCDICGVKFTRKGNLVKHMERHNIINDVYKCKLCDKQYNNYQSLIFHSCTTITKQYSCLICEKTFSSNSQLKIHQRLHSGERPFQCENCPKSFRSKQSLKQHRLIHFDNFPHECQYCDKKFRRLQSLVVHRRCHSEKMKNKKNRVLKQEGMNTDAINKDDYSIDVESNILKSILTNSPKI